MVELVVVYSALTRSGNSIRTRASGHNRGGKDWERAQREDDTLESFDDANKLGKKMRRGLCDSCLGLTRA
jgi:hypothetical protein